jgi:hypothetical protein
MTPRQEFKQCLIKGWLSHKVWQCASMVMIDHGIRHECDSNTPDMSRIENFLRDVEVPPFPHMTVSVYIAAFYPLTSASLFINSMTALQTFWREKQQTPDYSKTLNYERRYEKRRNKQIKFIRARELSKKHDWNTVK